MGSEKHFKTSWILCVVTCVISLAGISVNVWADTEKMLMTFEEFQDDDTAEISDYYPGVSFESVQSGWEWIAADVTTNGYNASSWPTGQQWNGGYYWLYGYVWAWTGSSGKTGKIVFDNSYTFSVEIGYTSRAFITLTAYDADGNPIDEDNGEANLRLPDGAGNQDGPGILSVTAPGGESIHSVIIDCEENSWVIDNVRLGVKLDVVKFDDVDTCISPDSSDPNLMYTIGISSKYRNHTNITIEDKLPREVSFDHADPNTGTFNWITNTYTWYLDELEGYDPNDPLGPSDPNTYFYLYTQVNYMAEPMSEIINTVTVESDQWDAYAEEKTQICCWGGDVIYVDRNSPGYTQIGVDWASAYQDLQDAIARAKKDCATIIKIADGSYYPSNESSEYPEDDTFEIPDGVSVYGGYAGWGAADPDKCDPNRFPTILSGYVDESTNNNTVVTMGNNSLLSGVTVEGGDLHGINGSDVSSTVENCVIKDNVQEGINCEDGDLTERVSLS
jgi:hypothetical protein